MNIDIRKISSMDEIREVANLMQRIWELSDREVVSTFEMRAVSTFGILLGAYNDDLLVGFIYAFPISDTKHYSHMMGVDPNFQGQNIGYLMKMKHREIAISKSISNIEWTVDPLLDNNAILNFSKLGCICNKYYPNYYGSADQDVGIYAGIPTDRFLVEWHLESPKVLNKMEKGYTDFKSDKQLEEDFITINKIDKRENLENKFYELEKKGKCLVNVPTQFQKIKAADLDEALKWRIFFRETATTLFLKDFKVVDYYIVEKHKKSQKNYYLFEKVN